uniref:photosystem I subunit III n=1 Tax=Haramonas pauciplastida TaxID=478668 RepID=UPI0021139C9C|nr:photosystem I subunit III [Haramonas pauciplastida]UTE94917.1 photosystem I subunit III [Haramonas pauciplastida]
MLKKKLLTIFLVFSFFLLLAQAAYADIAGLTPCSQSTAFTKRLNTSVTKLETRLKKYEMYSPPALALKDQITRTKQRFERYSKSNLLCGSEGLPHLITDGRLTHAAEFTLPGLMFIYITGWIGWVGRKYLKTISNENNPIEKEIIIDVPLALVIMTSGFKWPLSAWQELTSGDLLASDNDITVSPR